MRALALAPVPARARVPALTRELEVLEELEGLVLELEELEGLVLEGLGLARTVTRDES